MMQKLVSDLQGDAIVATDGEVGSLSDAYFDDERWTVRYFVVDIGRWLPGRKVLIAPQKVARAEGDTMRLELSRGEVERAPGIDTDPPVSALLRQAHDARYGYPYGGPFLWAAPMVPAAAPPLATGKVDRERAEQAQTRAEQSHLRASSAVVGCRIQAADGEIGHVEDFVVDDETWAIADMVVDTRNWLPGKKVLVPPSAISGIDWESGTVSVRLSRGEVERSARAS